ncbi:hypothetical protein AURDEDRAFT_117233 [Auricularia subglabra TFB-10046 SS5]|nr:hypothetical protein AURDEDRAFT_117233 [Auricularia subglabra TFB-10046 SS5]
MQASERKRSDPQLYVWLVTINREVTREEFQRFMACIDPGLRKQLKPHFGQMQDLPTLRRIVTNLLPRMLMIRQRIPRTRWKFETTDTGKSYIDSPESSAASKARKVMGFNIAEEDSIIAMAFAQGRKHQVVNIGIDVMRVPVPTPQFDVEKFIESHSHKLAPKEETYVVPALPTEVKIRRLCIMLAVKEAYTKAIGQPPGFDLSRITVDVPHQLLVDGRPQFGWEIRLFRANIGVVRAGKEGVQEEYYQCATVIWRGWPNRSEFIFADNNEEMASWMQFLTVHTVTKCVSALHKGVEEDLIRKESP